LKGRARYAILIYQNACYVMNNFGEMKNAADQPALF